MDINSLEKLNRLKHNTILFADTNEKIAAIITLIFKHPGIIGSWVGFVCKWIWYWIFTFLMDVGRFIFAFYVLFAIAGSLGANLHKIIDVNLVSTYGFTSILNISSNVAFMMYVLVFFFHIVKYQNITEIHTPITHGMLRKKQVVYFVPSTVIIWENFAGKATPHFYDVDQNFVKNYISANYDELVKTDINGILLTKFLISQEKGLQTIERVYSTNLYPATKSNAGISAIKSFINDTKLQVRRLLARFKLLDLYDEYKNVEVNDFLYLRKHNQFINGEVSVRRVIKKSVY